MKKIPFITIKELYQAYRDCLKHKGHTRSAKRFRMDLHRNMYQLYRDINSGKYEIGRSIAFIVTRPVKREVFAGNFRDRIVHHLLVNMHLQAFEEEMIEDSYSCRKGKGTLYGIKRFYDQLDEQTNHFKEKVWIFKGDLKGFFMHIDKNRLYGIIEEIIKKHYNYSPEKLKWVLDLYRKVIFNRPQDDCYFKSAKKCWIGLPNDKSLFFNDGLPIGNLTSQIFANLYLSPFDKYITNYEGVIGYGRYVDDFFIISKDKEALLNAVKAAEEYLKNISVTLHPKKRYIQTSDKGVDFIGAYIKPNRIYVRNRTMGNLYDKIKLFSDYVKHNEPTEEEKTYMVNVVNSCLGTLRHYKTYNLRKKLLTSEVIKPLTPFMQVCDDGKMQKLELKMAA